VRLSVLPNISTKDGTSNKNARLTNMLKVSGPKDIAEIRPGLVDAATSTGNAGGLVSFNGELISIYGTTLGTDPIPAVEGWVVFNNTMNSQGQDICYGNSKFYLMDIGGYFFTTTDLTDVVEKTQTTAPIITGRVLAAGGGLVCNIPGTNDSGGATVYWSDDDGATWNEEIDALGSGVLDGFPENLTVFYTGSRFYASVTDQSADCTSWASSDCISWTQESGVFYDSDYAKSFCSGLGYLYAITTVGACTYSTDDGATWTEHPTLTASKDVGGMVLSNGTLVAFGDIGGVPYIYRSTDGITFSESAFPFVFNGSPLIISVISGAVVITDSGGFYYTSTDDGASWDTNLDSSGYLKLRSAYGGGYTITMDTSDNVDYSAAILGAATPGTIPPLTTIATGKYDFAQSVI